MTQREDSYKIEIEQSISDAYIWWNIQKEIRLEKEIYAKNGGFEIGLQFAPYIAVRGQSNMSGNTIVNNRYYSNPVLEDQVIGRHIRDIQDNLDNMIQMIGISGNLY